MIKLNLNPKSITDHTVVSIRAWRREVKELAGNRCAHCGAEDGGTSTTRLESHHIFQKGAYPELSNVLENGICLCHRCHYAAHDGNYTASGLNRGKMAYDDIDAEAVLQTIKKKVETTIIVTLPKGEIDTIKEVANSIGESVNEFINRAIDETMARDIEKDSIKT